jgi:uncharacterized membrane protein YhaH (DUF805 family)
VPNLRTGGWGSSIPWLFFGLKGRISRRVYWLSYALLICLNAVVVGQLLGDEQASFSRLAQAIGPFVILVTVYSNVAVSVKRLHDVGYSGFLALAMFVPLVNFGFTIWIGMLPGTAGPNAYGDMPDSVPT